jgi:hypothetical protein
MTLSYGVKWALNELQRKLSWAILIKNPNILLDEENQISPSHVTPGMEQRMSRLLLREDSLYTVSVNICVSLPSESYKLKPHVSAWLL